MTPPGWREGTDPPYVPDREAFDAYTHAEIWHLVREALDPAALGRTADSWANGATALEYLFEAFASAVRQEFADWSGQAATAARDSTEAFVRAGAAAQEVCAAVHRLMELNSSAAQTVRDAIPVPVAPYAPDPDPVREAIDGGPRKMAHDIAAASALADAQDTLTFLYNSTLVASGDAVPAFDVPVRGEIAR
ncbi:WXG100 family type VII secretion target [Nocardia sp. NPDC005366]|uniref:WXG100 family type VII secretion target n=1 Tax=Nocardia sp. NPDC005366 TaxID=3156878 RepID=UPI0033B3F3E0